MGISKKSVPQGFTSRFSLGNVNSKTEGSRAINSGMMTGKLFLENKSSVSNAKPIIPVTTKDDFFATDLPLIPEPSDKLKRLLQDYQDKCDSDGSNASIHSKSKRKRTKNNKAKRKINGFMAFRSFYASSIPNTAYQRQLSCKLAEFWAEETNQLIWSRFASEYNLVERDMLFVDWLLQALNYSDTEVPSDLNIQTNFSWLFSANETGIIEDVYLYKADDPPLQDHSSQEPNIDPTICDFGRDSQIIDTEFHNFMMRKEYRS